jgi:hypothetical protein
VGVFFLFHPHNVIKNLPPSTGNGSAGKDDRESDSNW